MKIFTPNPEVSLFEDGVTTQEIITTMMEMNENEVNVSKFVLCIRNCNSIDLWKFALPSSIFFDLDCVMYSPTLPSVIQHF